MPPPQPIPVTYLFTRACPSHDEGLRLLRGAADRAGVAIAVDAVEVADDEQAAALAFPGSPTYRVAGADPFAVEDAGGAPTADACRVYHRPAGRVGPLPHEDDLLAALRAAADRAAAA